MQVEDSYLIKCLQDVLSRTLRINPNIKNILTQLEAEDPLHEVLNFLFLMEKSEARIEV